MNEEIKSLVESLKRGQFDDPAAKIELLAAALREHQAAPAQIIALLQAPQTPLRLAALHVCENTKDEALITEIIKLAGDAQSKVRLKLAEVLGGIPTGESTTTLGKLITDEDDDVRKAAIKSASVRDAMVPALLTALEKDEDWEVRLAAANALGEARKFEAASLFFKAVANESDYDVARRAAELLEKAMVEDRERAIAAFPTDITVLGKAEARFKDSSGDQRYPQLIGWIKTRTTTSVDPQALTRFGTDLTALAAQKALPHAHQVEEACATVLKLLCREKRRSIVLLGPAGSGKSALVNELVYQLAKEENGGWRVLRISPSDFMAGTLYIGEWETKVRDLVAAVKQPRKVIIYVPNLSDLSAAGVWSKSDSSVATALAPYLEEGSVVLLGESSAEAFEKGIGRVASLHRLFDAVLVPETNEVQTRNILAAVRDEENLPVPDDVLAQLQSLSSQFLGHIGSPGNAVSLLRAVIQMAHDSGKPLGYRDVLEMLSKSTGIPVDFLDDNVPLNSTEVQHFFEKRIIGQPEAVEAVVDLVTLIKSGLTDPMKPYGVMLFIGPTGVGKTELARALAEYIFGDAARLKRFDMSEFASPDAYVRLIGEGNQNGQLTDAIRQHPFSVILLDEIEKSHMNVFDLCLQIFDAGRLTDGRGRTVDFRRTIIILTSNIGAEGPGRPTGFNPSANKTAEMDKDRTFRELSRVFRPEFLNRIDRLVHFHPLSLEVAERIARREVDLVLQRSGIKRRDITVEMDPAVLAFLVREGYSPHFGARPLKRTVERVLLLPLARAIASGGIKGKTLLHITLDNNRVQVRQTRQQVEPVVHPPVEPRESAVTEKVTALAGELAALEPQVQRLTERKSHLLEQTQSAGFYDNVSLRTAVFDEIHKLDMFLALHQKHEKAITGLQQRLQRGNVSVPEESRFQKEVRQLASGMEQIRFVAHCRDAAELGDAVICLSLVERTGASQGGVEKIARMYEALAKRRKMSVEFLGEHYDEKRDRAYLLVAGLGAYGLFAVETGLHQLHHRYKHKNPRNGRELIGEDREIVRVEVLPFLGEPDKAFAKTVKSKSTVLKPSKSRLVENAAVEVALFHEPSVRSWECWTAGPRDAALERGMLVLHSQVKHTAVPVTELVRQYDLGLAPKIKDHRTGRSSTNVDHILEGHLDVLTTKAAASS
ncbi:MAG: ATPase, ATP-binding subunit [Verrucomicrobia bacterium]|jgi:ATP-dependent Clp protease ATP-binding subunit ClpC|nr:ATPase, ATP-binding subunit [Verrucomicrobiota bacterium]